MSSQTTFAAVAIGNEFTDASGFKYTKITETEALHEAAQPASEPRGPMQYEFDANDPVEVLVAQEFSMKSHAIISQTDNFKTWFKNSGVVDTFGLPRLVFHGTAIPKTTFRREGGCAGVGAYFTSEKSVAQDYAEMDASVDGDKPIVMEVYLSIKNPFRMTGTDSQAISAERRDELEQLGFDGVIAEFPDGVEYVAFNPEQIYVVAAIVLAPENETEADEINAEDASSFEM